MLEFDRVDHVPAALRELYLNSLVEPQELFLEQQVSAGTAFVLADYAYAVVFEETLVEFFVAPGETKDRDEIFAAGMVGTSASKVLCKSYDTLLLCAALSRTAHVTPGGLLFRRIGDPTFLEQPGLTLGKGTTLDAARVFEFNDDFFVDVQEIEDYAEHGGLFLLTKGAEVVGCGIGKAVIEGRPDIDIGMLVAPVHRRRGYGAHIISYLKQHYLAKGLSPICGCSADNIGSQRALVNAGFISEHRLLQISY